jgi:hypothetical protein
VLLTDWFLVSDLDFTKVKPYWQNCSGFSGRLVVDCSWSYRCIFEEKIEI